MSPQKHVEVTGNGRPAACSRVDGSQVWAWGQLSCRVGLPTFPTRHVLRGLEVASPSQWCISCASGAPSPGGLLVFGGPVPVSVCWTPWPLGCHPCPASGPCTRALSSYRQLCPRGLLFTHTAHVPEVLVTLRGGEAAVRRWGAGVRAELGLLSQPAPLGVGIWCESSQAPVLTARCPSLPPGLSVRRGGIGRLVVASPGRPPGLSVCRGGIGRLVEASPRAPTRLAGWAEASQGVPWKHRPWVWAPGVLPASPG